MRLLGFVIAFVSFRSLAAAPPTPCMHGATAPALVDILVFDETNRLPLPGGTPEEVAAQRAHLRMLWDAVGAGRTSPPAASPLPTLILIGAQDPEVPVCPEPPGLTADQRVLWNRIASWISWGRAYVYLQVERGVLPRVAVWHLADWHFERGMADLRRGRANSPNFRYAMDLVQDDPAAYLRHQEDLADAL